MKKMTIDDLARMVTKGFTIARKDLLETEHRLRGEIKAVDARVTDVDSRLSTIEFLLSSSRIDRLEDSVRHVKAVLKIK